MGPKMYRFAIISNYSMKYIVYKHSIGMNWEYLLKSWSKAYSHLFNKRGAWNKGGGGAKVAKSLNVEVGINVEGVIFWKKLVHNSNNRGVEGGKI